MRLQVKSFHTHVQHHVAPNGVEDTRPLRKVAVLAVVKNPYAGTFRSNLSEMIDASVELGKQLAELATQAMGPYEVESYGKGGVVGTAGEQEHANALLTTVFAEPLRATLGGKAWISSFTKVAGPGVPIDVPLAHKDALYVRSHYDGMTVMVPEAPLPDEIAVIFCVASRGRLHARVGGLKAAEIVGEDGLV
jgi:Amino acid synthesis